MRIRLKTEKFIQKNKNKIRTKKKPSNRSNWGFKPLKPNRFKKTIEPEPNRTVENR